MLRHYHALSLFNDRKLAQSMCMTGSDLCSSQKPWENQESTAKVIYDEFYEQVLIEQKINEIVFCKCPSNL